MSRFSVVGFSSVCGFPLTGVGESLVVGWVVEGGREGAFFIRRDRWFVVWVE